MVSAATLDLSCSLGRTLGLPTSKLVLCKAKDGRLFRFSLALARSTNDNGSCGLLLTLAAVSARSDLTLFPLDRELLPVAGGLPSL
jgi:hypothetical protein